MKAEPIIGVPVHAVDYLSTMAKISAELKSGNRVATYVIQTNVNSIVHAQVNTTYSEALSHATLSVPDGMPLVWLLRAKGYPIKDRVYGPDLMLLLCAEAAKKGWRCYLYGGAEGVPEKLRDVLTARFPGLHIVGTYSPPFRTLSEEEDREICRMINDAKPDIVWVGLGSPKQDIWMYEHRDRLNVSVLHGVGAAFDFLTGRVKQAPRWMMRAGLEWLYRLFQEPRRLWRRYTITNLKFVYYLIKSVFVKTPEET